MLVYSSLSKRCCVFFTCQLFSATIYVNTVKCNEHLGNCYSNAFS
jgi:hypothetical protein